MEGELGYSPSRWALSLHRLPRFNLRLQRVDGPFAPRDWDYQQTFLLLAAVTALGLSLNLLWLLVDVARHCRRARGEEEPRPGEICCPTWGCVTAIAVCCAGAGIGFYGNGEINDGMGQATRSLVAVNRTLADVEFLVSNSSATLSQVVREDLTQLEEIFSERPEFLLPTRNTRRKAEALLVHLRGLLFGRGLGFRLLELTEWGDRVEKARWPSYLALLLSDAFLCLGTLPLLAGRARCPLLWITALAALALVLSWLCLGVEFAAALALSDLCVQPEVYVLNTSQWEQVLSSEILEYYVRCDGTVPNPFQQRLTLSQRAMSEIHHQLLSVLRGSAAELPSAQPRLLSVLRALNASEGMFHHLAVRLHCLSSHKHLRDVWTGLCWDGLDGVLALSLFSLLTSASLSLLAGCLPRVWVARTAGTRVPPREETERTEEEEDVFRPPEWSQLPRYLSRPRLHTFSNYSRPSLRPPVNSRPRTPTLHYM